MKKLKEAATLFAIQTLLYAVLCVNMRAVAMKDYEWALFSDFAIATLNFFIIRKIAQGGDALHQWAGYVGGSLLGTAFGIWLSARLTP